MSDGSGELARSIKAIRKSGEPFLLRKGANISIAAERQRWEAEMWWDYHKCPRRPPCAKSGGNLPSVTRSAMPKRTVTIPRTKQIGRKREGKEQGSHCMRQVNMHMITSPFSQWPRCKEQSIREPDLPGWLRALQPLTPSPSHNTTHSAAISSWSPKLTFVQVEYSIHRRPQPHTKLYCYIYAKKQLLTCIEKRFWQHI